MQPYILLTVHRRYNVLAANLRHIKTLVDEFDERPRIVVIRGDAERKVDLLFEQWKMDGLVDFVYDRPSIGEGFNITLLEELNITQGFLNIKAERLKNHEYDPYYTIVQAGDCFAQPGAYRTINRLFIGLGIEAFTLYWKNHLNAEGVHTNFFAYNPQKVLGPFAIENHNVLEVQFLKQLRNQYGVKRCFQWCDLVNEDDGKEHLWFYHTHADVDGNLVDDLQKKLKISGEMQ